jgi:polygalacturonase
METLSIIQCGGIGDGVFDNTAAFQQAFRLVREASGGVVSVSAGVWRTGPLELPSHCVLELEKGSVLSFIPEFNRYRAVWTRWEGVECYAMHPCLYAHEAHHVSIRGEGTIDGNGEVWWTYRRDILKRKDFGPETELEQAFAILNPDYRSQPGGGGGRMSQFLAPPCIQFYQCAEVSIIGVTIINSPFWTVHPVYCRNLEIRNVTIHNPHDAPNTDGIDIDSCVNVVIEDCDIDVGDDAIALKSGSGAQGLEIGKPTARVQVSRCRVSRAHGGIVIGSETAGGIHDVVASDCDFLGTDRGIRIKTRRGRGGMIQNLLFQKNRMVDNLCPVAINMYYRCGVLEQERDHVFSLSPQKKEPSTPFIKNVVIDGLRAFGSKASCGFFIGLPEAPLQDLVLRDCEFSCDTESTISTDESEMFEGLPTVSTRALRLRYCQDAVFDQVVVLGTEVPFVLEEGASIIQSPIH